MMSKQVRIQRIYQDLVLLSDMIEVHLYISDRGSIAGAGWPDWVDLGSVSGVLGAWPDESVGHVQ